MILIYALELKTIKNQHASACLSSHGRMLMRGTAIVCVTNSRCGVSETRLGAVSIATEEQSAVLICLE